MTLLSMRKAAATGAILAAGLLATGAAQPAFAAAPETSTQVTSPKVWFEEGPFPSVAACDQDRAKHTVKSECYYEGSYPQGPGWYYGWSA
ncbi:hypothetical protein ACFWY9_14970 [Amycolatopsis sp. NPDC059027]|uniref:hypothetical protein n=1 Tax=Amycolatopsis sp. NPDC059027 TaxID=3346709 RepID=UPI00366A571D